MLEFLIEHMHDRQFLIMAFAAVAAIATVLTLAMPLLSTNSLGKRMKAVAFEREKIRARERERMARGEKVSLRQSPKQYMKTIVEHFNLTKWLAQEEVREKLVQAGYRGQAPYIAYLFFRMVTPIHRASADGFLSVRRDRVGSADADQDQHLRVRRLCRHAIAVSVPEEQNRQAPAFDPARISRCARSAPDLRRVRNVDRGRVPPREPGESARSRSRSPRNSR